MDMKAISSEMTSQEPSTSPIHLKSGPSKSLTTTLVYTLLVNRANPYLTAHRGRWFYTNQNLTPSIVDKALNGQMPLGIVAVSGTGTSRWSCIDVDRDEQLAELHNLARCLSASQSVLFEYSRRGGHLFIFHKTAEWHESRAFGQSLAEQFGLVDVEIYPKTDGLNAVRLPGSIHPKTGKHYPIIEPVSGQELSLEAALSGIRQQALPAQAATYRTVIKPLSADNSPEFLTLVTALSVYTPVHIYSTGKAKAKCLWHDDEHPSLLIKGSKFHCSRPDCVWGDINDLRRWAEKGIRPPRH